MNSEHYSFNKHSVPGTECLAKDHADKIMEMPFQSVKRQNKMATNSHMNTHVLACTHMHTHIH